MTSSVHAVEPLWYPIHEYRSKKVFMSICIEPVALNRQQNIFCSIRFRVFSDTARQRTVHASIYEVSLLHLYEFGILFGTFVS